MRLAGFIHRDISPGNCLLYMKDRHIKISDLEYARRYDSQGKSALPLTVSHHAYLPLLVLSLS